MSRKKDLMEDTLDKIIEEKNLSLCVECGKCIAGCPLAELHECFSYEFSALGVIKRAVQGVDVLRDRRTWFCLGCEVCAQMCPAGVKFAEFIEAARQLAISEGITEYGSFCERCGRYYLPTPTLEGIQEKLAERRVRDELVNLCPDCRKRGLVEKAKSPLASMR